MAQSGGTSNHKAPRERVRRGRRLPRTSSARSLSDLVAEQRGGLLDVVGAYPTLQRFKAAAVALANPLPMADVAGIPERKLFCHAVSSDWLACRCARSRFLRAASICCWCLGFSDGSGDAGL